MKVFRFCVYQLAFVERCLFTCVSNGSALFKLFSHFLLSLSPAHASTTVKECKRATLKCHSTKITSTQFECLNGTKWKGDVSQLLHLHQLTTSNDNNKNRSSDKKTVRHILYTEERGSSRITIWMCARSLIPSTCESTEYVWRTVVNAYKICERRLFPSAVVCATSIQCERICISRNHQTLESRQCSCRRLALELGTNSFGVCDTNAHKTNPNIQQILSFRFRPKFGVTSCMHLLGGATCN